MKLTRDLKIARRSLSTALRAASAMMRLPGATTPTEFSRYAAGSGGVIETHDFGSNPGKLAMLVYAPPTPPAPGAPLVVVLHGCGQDAAAFAADTGWMALADRLGFPLLLPEQGEANNRGRCFNWFRPSHTRRGRGEALSIRQMITEAIRRFGSDPRRVFIVGLSAGGAMAAAMLASYPEVFAAGAVVAGLPVGAASGPAQALTRMAQAGPERTAAAWAGEVLGTAPPRFTGPWPRLSVWTGSEDRVVDPQNARLLARQWSELHGYSEHPWSETDIPPATRKVWGPEDRPAVELWTIPGLAHGYPVSEGGNPEDFVPAAGIDATAHIARFWGLT
jgi:poly(hydroxyalkanoate) depolymerase family esterase